MADKKFDNLSGGIGDLGNILHNQGVSDLSWLAVDEETYRASEALPKQNLDMIPELQKALAREVSDDVPHLIPLKPHNIVNRNPIDSKEFSKTDMTNPIRNRVARLVMAGNDPNQIQEKVLLEFSEPDVRLAASAISEVMSERGVLGNVYINASHFPKCYQLSKEDKKLIVSCTKKSQFVLSKPDCSGCVNNQNGRCASFKKTLVSSVPYGPKLASAYIEQFKEEKRVFKLPTVNDASGWKGALKVAFLQNPGSSNPDGVLTVRTQQPVAKRQVTAAEVKEFLDKPKVSLVKEISSDYAKYARRMMEGHDDREMLVASGDPELVKLASEFGLLGHTWVDMDAIGSCKRTLAFINQKGGFGPDFVVRRLASCPNCHDASDGACCEIKKSSRIVNETPSYDRRVFAVALLRATNQGRVASQVAKHAAVSAPEGSDWKSLTAQTNLYAEKPELTKEYSGSKVSFWSGTTGNELGRAKLDEEEVRRTISSIMNHGSSGVILQERILDRYTREDLASFPELGKRLASEDGIQGHYYIDPTAYSDYGSGCSEGAAIFRKRGAQNIMASGKCTGCTCQTHPGWCSKYAKSMVRNVPEEVRVAARRKLPVIASVPTENPVEKYGLDTKLTVEVSGSNRKNPEISFASKSVDK